MAFINAIYSRAKNVEPKIHTINKNKKRGWNEKKMFHPSTKH